MIGYIHSYESMAAVDGHGIRYAVFLSGCPLRCAYCHNPDTWASGASKTISDGELAHKAMRYKPYFKNGGGITFSGGEPLLQADFINAVGEKLARLDIGYTLDTSGAVPLTDSVKRAVSGADGILLDLKFSCDADYIKYTGQGIARVLDMLGFLDTLSVPVTLRTVIVPGINDTEGALDSYIEIAKAHPSIKKYELLPFHTMGFFKYENLGIENRLNDTPPLSPERHRELTEYLASNF